LHVGRNSAANAKPSPAALLYANNRATENGEVDQ